MAATKADSGGEELVEMFLGFLESRFLFYKHSIQKRYIVLLLNAKYCDKQKREGFTA